MTNNLNIDKLTEELKVPFPMKTFYNVVIPQNIFQTWHTKMLPPLMFNAVKRIRKHNPRFNYKLFDDNECREFIKNNFKSDVLFAYDSLIPGAYKADLWRYCILFMHGGIYLDIKFSPLNGFKFINLCESEHLVLDADGAGIYNALMVCKPGNQILYKAIRQIVENVKNKYYGSCCLCPTGPKLLPNFISLNNPIVDLNHTFIDMNYKFINYKGIPIIKSYYGHDLEKTQTSIKPHYSILWGQRNIYA
jgi:mannosyltransferase OCH1-like enzyme